MISVDRVASREMEEAMLMSDGHMKSLYGKQRGAVKGVMTRLNETEHEIFMASIFLSWLAEALLRRVIKHYAGKMDQKKHQRQRVRHPDDDDEGWLRHPAVRQWGGAGTSSPQVPLLRPHLPPLHPHLRGQCAARARSLAARLLVRGHGMRRRCQWPTVMWWPCHADAVAEARRWQQCEATNTAEASWQQCEALSTAEASWQQCEAPSTAEAPWWQCSGESVRQRSDALASTVFGMVDCHVDSNKTSCDISRLSNGGGGSRTQKLLTIQG